eukprot:TRINITY_DN3655_c0_g1_i1.p1 TRINITY_DN3655_c0_g1~~TRINITY_DN3655_c0_g1_i1.p1  ORF type:complete len:263 (-),score=34.61 TRINITY_DN3655_c0_g1_i1:79-843(-)
MDTTTVRHHPHRAKPKPLPITQLPADFLTNPLLPPTYPIAPTERFSNFPSLQAASTEHFGPTSESNWAIVGSLIAGAYPGDLSEQKAKEKAKLLVEAGISTYLSTLGPGETRFSPYGHHIVAATEEALLERRTLTATERENGARNTVPKPSFLKFPINDQSIAQDSEVKECIDGLLKKLEAHELVYIHCWGGHGRTGTLVSLLLGIVYDLDPNVALYLCNEYHSKRTRARSRSPQSVSQYKQVRRLLAERWWDI